MLLNFVCVEFQQIVCQIVYNHQPITQTLFH